MSPERSVTYVSVRSSNKTREVSVNGEAARKSRQTGHIPPPSVAALCTGNALTRSVGVLYSYMFRQFVLLTAIAIVPVLAQNQLARGGDRAATAPQLRSNRQIMHEMSMDHHHQDLITTKSGKRMLPGGIDGAVTPELVPDAVAYNLFFSAVAEPADASPAQLIRERAKLARAQLSDADVAALIPILADFQQRQRALEQSFQTGASVSTDIDLSRGQLVNAARESMKTAITPDGILRLDALIQVEKRHMAVYPFPKVL